MKSQATKAALLLFAAVLFAACLSTAPLAPEPPDAARPSDGGQVRPGENLAPEPTRAARPRVLPTSGPYIPPHVRPPVGTPLPTRTPKSTPAPEPGPVNAPGCDHARWLDDWRFELADGRFRHRFPDGSYRAYLQYMLTAEWFNRCYR